MVRRARIVLAADTVLWRTGAEHALGFDAA
jgi:hypothetical protein